MGGQVGFVSTPGQGSTFWFILPISNERTFESDEPDTGANADG